MDSPAFSAKMLNWMPFRAIMETDLRMMIRSWLVRIWLVLIGAQALFMIALSFDEETPTSETLAGVLGVFPLVWSTFVIIVSGGAVSSESGVVADSILSKAITRTEYILAKLASRLSIVLGSFLLATVPVAYIIVQNTSEKIDTGGLIWGFVVVGMMLLFLTSLAVAFSALFNRTLVAVVVVWFVWYIAGSVTALLQADYLSPLVIVDSLPFLMIGDYDSGELMRSSIGFLALSTGAIITTLLHFARKDV